MKTNSVQKASDSQKYNANILKSVGNEKSNSVRNNSCFLKTQRIITSVKKKHGAARTKK